MSFRRHRGSQGSQISKWAILFLFALGAGPLTCFFWHARAVRQAERWPTVEARVIGAQVTSTTNLVQGELGNRIVEKSELDFRFAYTIDGRQYVSSRFYVFGHPPAHMVKSGFPSGRQFTARYDPRAPDLAVVEPGPLYYRLLVVGLICLGLAAAGVVYNVLN